MNKDLLDKLRKIISEEPWDEDALEAWADEVVEEACERDDEPNWEEDWEPEWAEQVEVEIEELRPRLVAFRGVPEGLPPLPGLVEVQMDGIAIMFDEDRDERSLLVAERLKTRPGVVGLYESEGCLAVFTTREIGLESVDIPGDSLSVDEFVPVEGAWRSTYSGRGFNAPTYPAPAGWGVCDGGPSMSLRDEVEQEIRDHPQWCSPSCPTFLADAYRRLRLVEGYSKETVQGDYDLCHVCR